MHIRICLDIVIVDFSKNVESLKWIRTTQCNIHLVFFKLKLITIFWRVKPWTLWAVHAEAKVLINWILFASGEDGFPGCTSIFDNTSLIGTAPRCLENLSPLVCIKVVPALSSSNFIYTTVFFSFFGFNSVEINFNHSFHLFIYSTFTEYITYRYDK